VRRVNYPDRLLLKRWDDTPHLAASKRIFQQCVLCIIENKFKKLGGFPEKLIMLENMLFPARLLQDGYKIACVPGAKVIHRSGEGTRSFSKQRVGSGHAVIRVFCASMVWHEYCSIWDEPSTERCEPTVMV
jgi:GT2 family glycosyltransferase